MCVYCVREKESAQRDDVVEKKGEKNERERVDDVGNSTYVLVYNTDPKYSYGTSLSFL